MTARANGEISAITRELSQIINELQDIENGIRRDFQGIGNDVCAARLGTVRTGLGRGLSSLNNLDTKTLAPGFTPPVV
jgi:hypothetical protein